MATLASKTVVVVGGTSGIGFAVAKASLASGAAHVIVASSSAERVATTVSILEADAKGRVTGETLDAKNTASIKKLFETIGPIDHLVWTSGESLKIGYPDIDLDSEEIRGFFDVRFWGPVNAAKYAQIKKGGSITLTIGSVVVKPQKKWSIVAGVAGAVDSVTRGLAVDLAPVRVNVISPGLVKTELWQDLPEDQRERLFETAAEKLLVKHVAVADEIAEAYLFVMKCDYITGQRIEVDGGYKFA